jgi:hypothetical protein
MGGGIYRSGNIWDFRANLDKPTFSVGIPANAFIVSACGLESAKSHMGKFPRMAKNRHAPFDLQERGTHPLNLLLWVV